ncbi:MAG: sensor histidine kinase, partial [Spirochaetota bacterium]
NILDQSHAEKETLRIRPESIALGDYLRSIEAVGALLAREKQLSFWLGIQGELPERISVDGDRLRQVLYNLISNAVKFTESGSIRLEVRRRSGRIRFAVSDSGEGISPEERGRIFLPFRQKRNSPRSGSGLGLSISQELVQLMGSRIWFASVVGIGSIFWFSLPVQHEAFDDRPPQADADRDSDERVTPLTGGDAASLSTDALDELIDLSRIGDLAGIRAQIAPRLTADEDKDFYLELDRLAESFQPRAVRKFLEAVRRSRLE